MTTTTDKPPLPENVIVRSEANGFTRLRAERAPYDFRQADNPAWRQYGQAGTSLYLSVQDERGAVSVKLLLEDYPDGSKPLKKTLGGGVATHDFVDPGEHPYPPEPCDLLPEGGKCWGSISYLAADAPAALYDVDGEDAVWGWLEHEHRITYEDKDSTP